MMTEQTYALVDATGLVVDTIVVEDAADVAELVRAIANPDIDTPAHLAGVVAGHSMATAKDGDGNPPGRGHRRAGNGKYVNEPLIRDRERIAKAEAAEKERIAKVEAGKAGGKP